MRQPISAGTIPYRLRNGEVEFCLVSSSRNAKRLVLPKGKVRACEDWTHAAQRETLEEAGLTGLLHGTCLPIVRASKCAKKNTLIFYLFLVHDARSAWQEKDKRARVWVKSGEISKYRIAKRDRKTLRLALNHPRMMRVQPPAQFAKAAFERRFAAAFSRPSMQQI
jgi:8-oxo-dGTP pyrophosphatase MutT (NUDIX family)